MFMPPPTPRALPLGTSEKVHWPFQTKYTVYICIFVCTRTNMSINSAIITIILLDNDLKHSNVILSMSLQHFYGLEKLHYQYRRQRSLHYLFSLAKNLAEPLKKHLKLSLPRKNEDLIRDPCRIPKDKYRASAMKMPFATPKDYD